MFDLLRRYGKYLGGVNYEKVQELLISEEERLKKVEEVLLREFSENSDSTGYTCERSLTIHSNIMKLERLRLLAKLEMLKKREKNLQEILIDLKMRSGVTLYEINKLVRELKRTRREIRKVKKLLKYLEYSSKQA